MNTYRIFRYLSVFLFATVLLAGGHPAMAFSVDNECSSAVSVPTVVTPTAFTDSGDTTGYTGTGDSLISACDVDPDSNNNHSVWWTWTSPAAPGPVEVSTFGSDYDTIVNIYSTATDCSALVAVTCNDDAGASFQSKAVFTPAASTVYYFQVVGYDSLEEGNLSLYVGDPQCTTAEDTPYAASTNDQWQSSINEAAEVVYAEYNPATLYDQIMKDGAALSPAVDGAVSHVGPANNNLGVIVWSEDVGGYEQVMKRDAAGTVSQVTTGNVNHSDPDINDSGEIVWSEDVGSYFHIVSSTRGQLTTVEPAWYYSPSINNGGEVCWSQYDAVNGQQVGCLGGYTTSGVNPKYNPSVNNLGDLVWEEENSVTGDVLINSTGAFSDTGCPAGGHYEPSINACGDVVFTNFDGLTEQIYLSGTGTSCLPTISGVTPDPIDPRGSAFTITGTGFQIPADATAIDICTDSACATIAASITSGFIVNSDTQITATDPNNFADGNYYVRVTTPAADSNVFGPVLFGGCDPSVDLPTAASISLNPPGGCDRDAGCNSITMTATVTGGCQWETMFQVRDNNIRQLYSPICTWTEGQTTCTWDPAGFPADDYYVRVMAWNKTTHMGFKMGEILNYPITGNTCDPNDPANDIVGDITYSMTPGQVTRGTIVEIDFNPLTGGCGELHRCHYDYPAGSGTWGVNMDFHSQDPITYWDTGWDWEDTAATSDGAVTLRCFAWNAYENPVNYRIWMTDWEFVSGPPPVTVSLSALPSGGQTIEHDETFAPIDLTAIPSNFTPTSYTFEVNKDGGGWGPIAACPAGPSAVCTWDAEANGEGSYEFRVTATDGVDSPTDQLAACSLIRNPPLVTLSPDLASPQEVGAVVQLTATPQHFLNANTAEYHFQYRAVGAPTFTDLCGTAVFYDPVATCNWDTNALSAGDYDLKVDAGDVGTNTQMATDSIVYTLDPVNLLADVTAISPSSIVVSALPQSGVVFDGAKFTGITAAALDDGTNNYALSNLAFVNDAQFTADVPAGVLPGTYNVQVTNGAGTNITSTAKLTIAPDCNPSVDLPTGTSLVLNPPGGCDRDSGCNSISMTATVTGGCQWETMFQVRDNTSGQLYSPICTWTEGQTTCTWDPAGFPADTYYVRVMAWNKPTHAGFQQTEILSYPITGATCDPNNPANDIVGDIVTSPVYTGSPATPQAVTMGATVAIDFTSLTGGCGQLNRCHYDDPAGSATWGVNIDFHSQDPITYWNTGWDWEDMTPPALGHVQLRCFSWNAYESPVVYRIWTQEWDLQ